MSEDCKLGELLVGWGLIRTDDLNEAMDMARATGLPLGQALVMADLLLAHQLRCAVAVQSLLRDNLLPPELAQAAMKLVVKQNYPLDVALSELGWESDAEAVHNQLGDLLVEAQVISREDFHRALHSSLKNGLPLGRLLVAGGLLDLPFVESAVRCQSLIRKGSITRTLAVACLNRCRESGLPIERVLELVSSI